MIEGTPISGNPQYGHSLDTLKKLEKFELVSPILLQQRVSFKAIEIRRLYAELAQGKT